MEITKIINNNIVCSMDENHQELIIMGCGLGFKKKIGEEIEDLKIEKIYKLENQQISNKLQELLFSIPMEHVNTCNRIIEHASSVLAKKLNDNIYLTLTDHISFAIQRFNEHMEYKNALLWEIKKFYPKEFEIGRHALGIIEEDLGVLLSEDEAGFIALHIVNAQLETKMENTVNITTLIHDILDIVREYYRIEFDEDSLYYERFITHLKFFGQRIFQKKDFADDDFQFQSMIKQRYTNDYNCALLIKEYVLNKYGYSVSEEEIMYLTVHLRKLSISGSS